MVLSEVAMKKILIGYWTNTGNTQEMAEQIAAGAEKAGAEVQLVMMDDMDAEMLAGCDVVALGCAAGGMEEPDAGFMRYYEQVKGALAGKPVALFGSYGWGNGAYMEELQADVKSQGAEVIEVLTIQKKPDAAGAESCRALGRRLAD